MMVVVVVVVVDAAAAVGAENLDQQLVREREFASAGVGA